MSIPEFGEKISSNGKKSEVPEFGEVVKEPSRFRSLISAPIKGAVKAGQELARATSMFSTSPFSPQLEERLTEELLPTQEKLPEELLERGGKLATYLAGGEGSLLSKGLRSGVGALAGQTVKGLGGGEIAQDIAELASMSAPDLAKNLVAKKSQSRVVNFLKNKGWTDREITPLIQDPKKIARYAKFSSKGEKVASLNKDIYNKFDSLYSDVRSTGESLPALKGEQVDSFLGDFENIWEKIPRRYRRKIQGEVDDLFNSPMKFSDFVDFNQAVNAEIGAEEGGRAVLGRLKEATQDAQRMISPELSEELALTNELYSRRANFAKHMKPKQIDDLAEAGKIYGLAAGIADGNFGIIKGVIGLTGARKLAREILINPRLQNISDKMLKAFQENKIPTAMKLYELFEKESRSIPEQTPSNKNDDWQ